MSIAYVVLALISSFLLDLGGIPLLVRHYDERNPHQSWARASLVAVGMTGLSIVTVIVLSVTGWPLLAFPVLMILKAGLIKGAYQLGTGLSIGIAVVLWLMGAAIGVLALIHPAIQLLGTLCIVAIAVSRSRRTRFQSYG